MNPAASLRLLFVLLFSFVMSSPLFAGDSVTFPTFNPATITRGATGVSTNLNVSAVPSKEYLYASVTGDFTPGAVGLDIFSINLMMELSDGSSTVYWPASVATQGFRKGTTDAQFRGTAALKWYGPLPKNYAGGTPLRVRFFSESGTGALTATISNVVVTIHPSTPGKTFTTFNSATTTGAGPTVTNALNVSGMSGEYFILKVTGSFTPAATKSAFSNTTEMALTNGGSTFYQPFVKATRGQLDNANATILEWTLTMPTSYTGGPLSVAFRDPYTNTSGPFTSNMSNVSVQLYPVSTPVKTFDAFDSGKLTGGSSVSKALDVTGLAAADYYYATVTGNFVPNSNPLKSAYSQTIQLELNNGGSTIFLPATNATFGSIPDESPTTLKWTTVLPKAYVGGGPLTAKFIDTYTDGSGPYTSDINNVVVTLQPSFVSASTITSLNRVETTPSKAATVNYLLTFSAPVTGVTASNFSLSPTLAGASIGTPITANSGLTWTIPVTTGTADGTLQLNVANSTGFSSAISTALPSAGQPFVIDKTAPTISIGTPSATLTKGGPVTYTVTYADTNTPTSTLAAGNITLNKTGTANATAAITGTGVTRTVTLSSITGDGTIGISIAAGTASDTAGNTAAAAGPSTTFTVDNTGPTISIGTPSASLTKAGPVSYTVTYADAYFSSSTLAAGNITLNKTGTANATAAVTGTGLTRTVTLSSITGDGTIGISIAAGTASDTPGNIASAAGPSTTFTADNTAPSITSATTANGAFNTAFSYTIIATDAVSYTATALPTGLTLTGAVISGTPTQTGVFNIPFGATDIAGNTSAGTLVLTIAKASATVTLGSLAQTYDTTARPITATTNPAGLTVNFTYNGSATVPINAGSYTVVGTISNANYQGTASGTLVVSKASATVTLGSLAQTYDTAARPITATTTPAGLTVNFTYNGSATVPINAGSYTAVGTISDANYQGTASGTLVVSKASATVVLGNTTQTYNATPRAITATTTPANLPVTFSYNGSPTAPTNVSSTPVIATINDTNYQGTASGTLVINKALLTVTPDPKSRAFGTANPVLTATITGFAGGENASVVSGTPAFVTTAGPNSPVGDYPVTASTGTLAAANYSFTFIPGLLSVTRVNFDSWNDTYFTPAELADSNISGPSADADGDGISNLLEFAFGTNPRVNASGPAPLVYDGALNGGGTLTSTGQPLTRFEPSENGVDFRVIFIRRNPATTEGITYIPQFSAGLDSWQSSQAEPTILATDGDLQVVSVPYPLFVNGKKARFFRLQVVTPN